MTKPAAFWDASALVPLCVAQQETPRAFGLLRKYRMVVWWATTVELTSALVRLLREGALSTGEYAKAQRRAEQYADIWRVLVPSDSVLDEARSVLERFPLRAADSLQLAASLVRCDGRPKGRVFLTFDQRLGEAAEAAGFTLG